MNAVIGGIIGAFIAVWVFKNFRITRRAPASNAANTYNPSQQAEVSGSMSIDGVPVAVTVAGTEAAYHQQPTGDVIPAIGWDDPSQEVTVLK